jgi:chromosome segregation ATPase
MEFKGRSPRIPRNSFMQTRKSIHNYDVPIAEPKQAKPTPPNVAQLNESVRLLEEEINTKKAQLDAKITTARRLQDEQQRLQARVDLASDELAVAQSQHDYFVARLEQLLQTLPTSGLTQS